MRTIPNEVLPEAPEEAVIRPLRVALVGAPNVGKSSLFHRLTGRYVTVSNYPGTSVEVARGRAKLNGVVVDVADTPGLHSLLPSTEEERVARHEVLAGDADIIVHVLDAKNITTQLSLTLQLMEIGRPMVVAANMVDEAERLGLRLDFERLSERLGIPVVPVVAITGRGIGRLQEVVADAAGRKLPSRPVYGNGIGRAIRGLRDELLGTYAVDPMVFASLLIQGDEDVTTVVRQTEQDAGKRAGEYVSEVAAGLDAPAAYRVAVERQRAAEQLLQGIVGAKAGQGRTVADVVGRWLLRPVIGIPVLVLVLYVGLFQFVGLFGAGVLVDWLETSVFQQRVNPFLERLFSGIPWEQWRSLYVGEYGLLTLGLRYAVALILPIVGTFFLVFSVLEDSGYFPRLALLMDRLFKRLGLSGRAVIPIALGFACDTMATMVTRTLETRRERWLATFLLALAVPCSAQLGVILALLAGYPLAFGVWLVVIAGTFVLIGAIGARVLPGDRPSFQMEIPPLRRPRVANVVTKTVTRMQWYFMEVLPLFLLASVLLWIGDLTGAFQFVVDGLTPVVGALGLPADAAPVFLFGFFRRDYGAAGLFDLNRQGLLDPIQLAVAAVTLTLFVPCVAQFLMMIRERGWRTAIGMAAFITPFAFGVGFVVNLVLRGLR